MIKRFPSLRNLWIPLVVTTLLLIPFAMYEVYYVEGREEYLKDRSFRLLAAIGDQIDALVNIEADKLRAAGALFDDDPSKAGLLRQTWAKENFEESTFTESSDPRTDKFNKSFNRDGSFFLQIDQVQSSFSIALTYLPGEAQEIKENRSLDEVLKKRVDQLAGNFLTIF